ncbi:Protein-tyrosine-phosphatase [Reichenbachiella faecimaris]|uniref:Protein-tyrosine-phosphatase n=1 Tax=Reichenbachiella faecimaris TaxID=692418 RepID=A0A1W2GNM5_REIFA|nr:protein-tyrosine-phosphatase [Reichenbachiella faecimaris]SMD37866.1 Protein-tyrosine-phosphatase [Reichenbachiella faecimaris]
MKLFDQLVKTVEHFDFDKIANERKGVLEVLVAYIQSKVDAHQEVNLNFICTHNSRRSQFSQIWAQTAADYYGIEANCFSGGVEVTAFNERAVDSIKRAGFQVSAKGQENPVYYVLYAEDASPMNCLSKLFDDPINNAKEFAAVMTCSHADENCPFIPGTEKRIPVRYDDPKEFDDTLQEADKYDERSMQIANELFYVFSKIVGAK